MTLGTREDERGIEASLHVCAERGLHVVVVGVACDLLELIYSHETWLVGMVQVIEDFVQRRCGVLNIAQANAPSRIIIDVERQLCLQRA